MAFGGVVKLQGETEYRAKLRLITQNLREMSSAMKIVTNTFDRNDQSITALNARSRALNDVLNVQKQRVAMLSSQYEEFKTATQKSADEHEELGKQLSKAKMELNLIEAQCGKNSMEYAMQEKVVQELQEQYDDSTKAQDKNRESLSKLGTELNKAKADVAKTEKSISDLDDAMKEAGNQTGELGDSVEESGEKAQKASEGYTMFKNTLANLASDAIRRVVDGLKDMSKQVVETGMSFDSAMSQVGAISGASAEDMAKLSDKAQEMGAKTKFTATESAEALTYMAMAGWKTSDMLDGLEGIMNLAASSGEDLATTSDIVTDALTAMGYSAKDSGRLADVMAAAASNSNTNVAMMGETFKYAAPVVGALGYTMEDTALAIGLMANAGIKGERAGTALRAMMTRMSAPTKDCADAMNALGISITDNDGNMKSLYDLIQDLRGAFSGLSEVQQTQYAKSLVGTEAMSGFLAVVNAAPADFDKLKKAVDNSTGSAERMANVMLNNVGGQMTLLKSKLEGVQLTIYRKLEPSIRKAIDSISKSVDSVNWKKFGREAGEALQTVTKGFTWLLSNGKTVASILAGIVSAMAINKVASFAMQIGSMSLKFIDAVQTAGSLSKAMAGLNITMNANPIILVASAVAGLVVALTALKSKTDENTEAQAEFEDALKTQADSINQSKEAYDSMAETRQKAIDQGMTEMSYYQSLAKELNGIVDENGKVKEGYEARASFITGQLADALGVEISYNDGIIEGYDNLKDSIDEVIQKKKAQIILDAQETGYAQAISNQNEEVQKLRDSEAQLQEIQSQRADLVAQKTQILQEIRNSASQEESENLSREFGDIDKKIQKIDEQAASVQSAYDQQKETVSKYAYDIAQYENNMALAHEGRYSEMTNVGWQYVQNFQSQGDAQLEQLQAQYDNTATHLELLKQLKDQSNSDMYDSQITADQNQLAELQNQMAQYEATTQQGLDNVNIEWGTGLDMVMSQITGANVKFKENSDGNMQAYINGVKEGQPKSKAEMAELVKQCMKEVADKKPGFKQGGEDLATGVGNGINNRSGWVFGVVSSFASNILGKLRAGLKEHSPSKATNEMGRFLLQGLGIGIESEEGSLFRQVDQLGKDTLSRFDKSFGDGFNVASKIHISGLSRVMNEQGRYSIKADQKAAENGSNAANTDIVGAVVEALGRVKIEMDDETMGKFVEKTVTQAVYN